MIPGAESSGSLGRGGGAGGGGMQRDCGRTLELTRLRMTVRENILSARDQYVTAFRHTAGRTGEADAAVSVR